MGIGHWEPLGQNVQWFTGRFAEEVRQTLFPVNNMFLQSAAINKEVLTIGRLVSPELINVHCIRMEQITTKVFAHSFLKIHIFFDAFARGERMSCRCEYVRIQVL